MRNWERRIFKSWFIELLLLQDKNGDASSNFNAKLYLEPRVVIELDSETVEKLEKLKIWRLFMMFCRVLFAPASA